MLVGIIGKLMKSLYYSLTPMQDSPRVVKTLLSKEWFRLTDEQLQLYKQLYHIMFEINKNYSSWQKTLLPLLPKEKNSD